MKMNKQQSIAIDLLRLPLIIGVVCIHARINSHYESCINVDRLFETFLGDMFGPLAVPLFFIMSGYLFFFGSNQFDKNVYYSKIAKRLKSLIVPYIIWNLFAWLIYSAANGFNIVTFFKSFWVIDRSDGSHSPMDAPLWFIRNLFIVMLVSPLIWTSIKKTKWYLVLLLVILP